MVLVQMWSTLLLGQHRGSLPACRSAQNACVHSTHSSACFYAHTALELRHDVSTWADRWRLQQTGAPALRSLAASRGAAVVQQLTLASTPSAPPVRVIHELPEGSTWADMEHRTQPCIEFLQTGTCPAGHGCRRAHSLAQLQPRPVPAPQLRAALEQQGWALPPALGELGEQQQELPLPLPAAQQYGAWQAACEVSATAAMAADAGRRALALAAKHPAHPAPASGSPAAGAKREAAQEPAGLATTPKRQRSDGLGCALAHPAAQCNGAAAETAPPAASDAAQAAPVEPSGTRQSSPGTREGHSTREDGQQLPQQPPQPPQEHGSAQQPASPLKQGAQPASPRQPPSPSLVGRVSNLEARLGLAHSELQQRGEALLNLQQDLQASWGHVRRHVMLHALPPVHA